jgi:predicted PurR-regulated permease PerM
MANPQPNRSDHPLWDFATRVLIAVAIAGGAYLLWHVRFALLTAFAAVLLAVLLLSLADLVRRLASVPHGWALTISITLIVLLTGGLFMLVGTQVQAQFGELWRALPEASQSVEQRLGIQLQEDAAPAGAAAEAPQSTPGAVAVEQILDAAETGAAADAGEGAGGVRSAVLSRVMDWLASYGLTIVDAILGIILVVVAGVYLAIDPSHYRRGTVKLFPPTQHDLIGETMTDMGRTLRWWLLGKLISMSIIGALAGVGTWLLGLPAPLALGIFSGLTEFVPIIGPIVGAVPALLLAATEGVSTVLWTLLLFLGIQQIESNIVAPLVQERMVTIPAALLVLGVGLFGGLFGLLGLVLSGPLLVVSYVAVKKLWMRRALRESTPMPTDAPHR